MVEYVHVSKGGKVSATFVFGSTCDRIPFLYLCSVVHFVVHSNLWMQCSGFVGVHVLALYVYIDTHFLLVHLHSCTYI